MKSNCRIIQRQVAGYQAYFFTYRATEEVAFEFSMLCEVGQPWIPEFKSLIAKNKLDLVTTEIPAKPWVITVRREDSEDHQFHCPECNAQYTSQDHWWKERCQSCGYQYPQTPTQRSKGRQPEKKDMPKPESQGLRWTPVKRGKIYCSPICGAGCTMAAYQAAHKHGSRMRQSMNNPDDWEIRVHENMGWFTTLVHIPSEGLLTVHPGYSQEPRYSALLSLDMPFVGDCRWSDHESFKTPQEAADHVAKLARECLRLEARAFERVVGRGLPESTRTPATEQGVNALLRETGEELKKLRLTPLPKKQRRYMGVNIEPADLNSSGLRWTALTANGRLRADTLDGLKSLLRKHLKEAKNRKEK